MQAKEVTFRQVDEFLEKHGVTYMDYIESKEDEKVEVSKMRLDRLLNKITTCDDCPVTICGESYLDDAECHKRQEEFLQVQKIE